MVFWKHRNDRIEHGLDGRDSVGHGDVRHENVRHENARHDPVRHGASEGDIRAAYDKGRSDERKRHKSHPVLGLLVFAIAIVGGLMLFLAVREGSFSRAGAVADAKIAEARVEGPGVVREVTQGARSETEETARILAQNGNGG